MHRRIGRAQLASSTPKNRARVPRSISSSLRGDPLRTNCCK
jgi:hypothetical protein